MKRWIVAWVLLACAVPALGQIVPGLDISMLPEIEKAGVTFRDAKGKPADAITVMRDHGWQLFRVRLFVNPEPEFWKTEGATQDLAYVRKLCSRIKAAGGQVLLDLHYSDTWADPLHQKTPRAWRRLDFDGLVQQMGTYTESVLKDLQAAGVGPDMVQIGNEITPGILWPDGKVDGTPAAWQRLATLLDAGCQAVRRVQEDGKKIPIMLHVHSGGRRKVPQRFFKNLLQQGGRPLDFDVIGLSFYPAWNDSIDALKANMRELAEAYDNDIYVIELSYPYKSIHVDARDGMKWPMSKKGQQQFLADIRQALAEVPNGRGRGYCWWYPEAVPVRDRTMRIFRNGAEALFDTSGRPLPALRVK